MSEPRRIFAYNYAELACPDLTRRVRTQAATVAMIESLTPSDWCNFLHDLLRDLNVGFYNTAGQSVDLPIHVLGVSDHEIDIGDADLVEARIANWFAYICKPVPAHVTPYVTRESRERFRVLASLLIAAYPEETAGWPRIIPANDNWLSPVAANDNEEDSDDRADES